MLKRVTYLFKEQRGFDTVELIPESKPSTILNPIDHRKDCGRPNGSTSERKRLDHLCIISVKNETATKYTAVLKDKTTARLENGTLKRIIAQVIDERYLPPSTNITPASIITWLKRGKLVTTHTTVGLYFPLLEMEPAVVDIITTISFM